MPNARSWAARIALMAAATTGVVAACYDRVPGPSGPLPPTKEVQGLGPKPKQVKPNVVEMQTEIAAAGTEPAPVPSPTSPTHEMRDGGVNDVIDLPPVPDSSVPLDGPGVNKR